ncbi:translocon-associated protein subunit alpha-like [Trifolium pratense]|nr:translocon-associated protein subunit alpha-like [Trifolium pratense]
MNVARCQSDSDEGTTTEDASDIGIVGDDVQYFDGTGTFSSASGIDTISVFPKNIAKLVKAGEETELLVGVKNDGESSLNVVAIKASIHLPVDHRLLVQNLTAQVLIGY